MSITTLKNKGIGGHQSANMRTDEWLTPREILQSLGTFDLDPCSPVNRPWPTALHHFTKEDNGLLKDWFGRVWLNSPYGQQLESWMQKMSLHANGMALIFARTDTNAFHKYIFPYADSLFFFQQRLTFCTVAGIKARFDGGAPSVLISYGEQNVEAAEKSGFKGKHVFLNSAPISCVLIGLGWRM